LGEPVVPLVNLGGKLSGKGKKKKKRWGPPHIIKNTLSGRRAIFILYIPGEEKKVRRSSDKKKKPVRGEKSLCTWSKKMQGLIFIYFCKGVRGNVGKKR